MHLVLNLYNFVIYIILANDAYQFISCICARWLMWYLISENRLIFGLEKLVGFQNIQNKAYILMKFQKSTLQIDSSKS